MSLTEKENKILDGRKRFNDPKFDITITEIKRNIEDIARDKITLKEVAKNLGFSEAWLSQLVFMIYGKSAMQLKRERI